MMIQVFKPIIVKAIAAIGKQITAAITGEKKRASKKRQLDKKKNRKEKTMRAANRRGNGMKKREELEEREFEEAYEAHMADELNDTW